MDPRSHSPRLIKVAFLSGTDDLNARLVERMRELFPELPLYVVSEMPPSGDGFTWVPYHIRRSFSENWARAREAFRGHRIRLAGVMLVPNVPYRRMRLMAILMAPLAFLGVNENLNDFMFRPRSLPNIARHFLWRIKNFVRWQLKPRGWLYEQVRRLRHPSELRLPLWYWNSRLTGALHRLRLGRPAASLAIASDRPHGISLVIPSRDGRDLLAAQLDGILADLATLPHEVIVSDNGSTDGTVDWLARTYPQVSTVVSAAPLSFARAVNAGIRAARFSHVLLLNNDMLVEPGFAAALLDAFARVPDLFSATAQIRFPAGTRREETGKAVLLQPEPTDFPVRCLDPIPGENLSYVLYGSGGCSLYRAAKLRALGDVNEIYDPAYVEDLDLGWRAWQQGWPTVFVAGAVVEHRHRATTSRFYSAAQLDAILELNYLRFLSGAVATRDDFDRMWRQALDRLLLLAREGSASALAGLRFAPRAALAPAPPAAAHSPAVLCTGGVAVFPGRRATAGRPRVLIASPYLPYPLSHGGAVRMYNLMRRAAADFDQVLVAFCDAPDTPPAELLEICAEVVLVARRGSHSLPATERPEVVEEFASPAFSAALRQTIAKWSPAVAQLEFTQMAQYEADCRPARVILIEHDITFDLYQQLLALGDDWELRRQLARWLTFETAAWKTLDRVVVMSPRDLEVAKAAPAVLLANGVDLDRYQPSGRAPEPRRILFIGSFAHLPNLLALEFFLHDVWPHLEGATLHVIAGSRPEYFKERYRDRVNVDLARPGIELEGFVPDVRPAYERAAVVVAPLVASAGTNIKILEAMAMRKAIVSTPQGVNGLDDLVPGAEYLLAQTGEEMAAAITRLLDDPAARAVIEAAAQARVQRDYGWDTIAQRQAVLYRDLMR